MSEQEPLLSRRPKPRTKQQQEEEDMGDTMSSVASGFSEVSDSFELPARVGPAEVTRGPAFAARGVLCACESRLPDLMYVVSAELILQTHLSRPMRSLHVVFRAPPAGRLIHMTKLTTHHLVAIATAPPSRLLRLVFLRERRVPTWLRSCFGWKGRWRLDEEFTVELSPRAAIEELASVVEFSDKRLFVLPRHSALVQVVDAGGESERLGTSMIRFPFELLAAERLVVFGAELLAVSCADGCVRLMRYTRDRTFEEVQQLGAFGRPLALGALLWDPIHSLLFLLARERDSTLASLHCLYVKRKDAKSGGESASLLCRRTAASAPASASASSSRSTPRRIKLMYSGQVAPLEHSLDVERAVIAGRDFGSERRRLLFLDTTHESFTQYFLEF